ncbi:TPM domain-containing protein [Paractinoplanes atraurantiacus]|uniref:TLP18.3, Psb32 and MOLO-1 founding protein of phosphatase n=1 Tax=Paractinoplanes atraurantiacus TaxID=1036182 RepID=A0A285JWV9_9ACTN|nr:TPM domain-containing protein [Actinoplanes atraurantiacus]SNY64802.1 TLP18.3, Psb32 and MOLO-1 founding protein of phosphatase [Actinoplanes atraurantiacus]
MPRRAVSFLIALSTVLLVAPPALAEAPQRLDMQVTDASGWIDNRAPVDNALQDLQDKTGIQLWVVLVDSFDGTPAQSWTDETARLSDLGDRDALLAIAVEDRSYAYSFPDDSRISEQELAEVAEKDIEPALKEGDWSGAVVAAAEGYQDAASSSSGLVWAVLIVLLVVVAGLAWVFLRRRHRQAAPPAPSGPSVADLSSRANALLIELDDDLRASERELELATAQYGAAATEQFRSALDEARRNVGEAFQLRMTLDETPTPDERATLTRIIELCEAADKRLDAESDAFDRLRDLESRAAEAADEVDRRRAQVEAALPGAAATVQDLLSRFSGGAVTAITGNADQIRERLTYAADSLRQAREAISTGRKPEAALAVRGSEQAVDQAAQLVSAIERAATELPAARSAADGLLAEVTAETAAGRTALTSGGAVPPGLAAAVTGGEQALAEVRAALATERPDPVDAVARLQAADATLDAALAAARDAAERSAHARSMLAQALPVVRAEVFAANDFITTRRGAVDYNARAALSEAQRHLSLAESLAASDPVTALAEAQQAHQLASRAGQSARVDVQTWGGGGGYRQPGGFDAGAFAGAVLGGILAGGGRSHGGFGGSNRRGGGGHSGGGGRRGGGGRF